MNKYKNKPVKKAGMRFDSQAESRCYDFLQEEVKLGTLSNLRTQVTIELIPGVKSRVDFVAFDSTLKEDVALEFKGFETDIWRLKKSVWKYCGPMILKIYRERQRKGQKEIFLAETIVPPLKRL